MPFRLGILGMWHTHAEGIVRQVAAYPKEFTLVGCYDPDPKVVADRHANECLWALPLERTPGRAGKSMKSLQLG